MCDPPWSGPDCADASLAPAPTLARRVLRVLMFFAAAVAGGLALGWLRRRWESFGSRGGRGYSRIGDGQRDL